MQRYIDLCTLFHYLCRFYYTLYPTRHTHPSRFLPLPSRFNPPPFFPLSPPNPPFIDPPSGHSDRHLPLPFVLFVVQLPVWRYSSEVDLLSHISDRFQFHVRDHFLYPVLSHLHSGNDCLSERWDKPKQLSTTVIL